ncbi:hypothetical protein GCM10008018_25490 [Paenibacillus marchantiophytorum]|uniref:ABC transporter substrate-binding protein n=1 Tax=Paenibacillus marchantiophytorum TaxID=1619310 RepID=A0ABQ1EML4_9BACL|nr:ABC transporter substrate-binding protein [Paenibacillus marchantiophytorum]GFZ78849.1 hypothetical protein GCM10008018_25490 [Paenibacillus marchantiophytorum]
MRHTYYKTTLLVSVLLLLMSCSVNPKGTLTIYAGLYEDHAIKAIEAFQKETGIKTSYVRMSGGEILDKIRVEKGHPTASVWFGGPADTFVQAKSEGLLTSYVSPNTRLIDKMYRDPDGYWTGIYVGSIALVSNKNWLQDVGLPTPQSWNDLLSPKYKGMIMMADPRSSGTAYAVLATLVQLWGEEEAYEYMKKLHAQVRTYTTSGNTLGRYIGMGEAGTAIMFSHVAVKNYKEGFRTIIVSYPNEGTGYEIGAVGIINGAPHAKEAKQFVDWALTKQAQELGKQVGNYQLLTNQEAVSPEEAVPLAKLHTIRYRLDWAGVNRERLIDRWVHEVLGVQREEP